MFNKGQGRAYKSQRNRFERTGQARSDWNATKKGKGVRQNHNVNEARLERVPEQNDANESNQSEEVFDPGHPIIDVASDNDSSSDENETDEELSSFDELKKEIFDRVKRRAKETRIDRRLADIRYARQNPEAHAKRKHILERIQARIAKSKERKLASKSTLQPNFISPSDHNQTNLPKANPTHKKKRRNRRAKTYTYKRPHEMSVSEISTELDKLTSLLSDVAPTSNLRDSIRGAMDRLRGELKSRIEADPADLSSIPDDTILETTSEEQFDEKDTTDETHDPAEDTDFPTSTESESDDQAMIQGVSETQPDDVQQNQPQPRYVPPYLRQQGQQQRANGQAVNPQPVHEDKYDAAAQLTGLAAAYADNRHRVDPVRNFFNDMRHKIGRMTKKDIKKSATAHMQDKDRLLEAFKSSVTSHLDINPLSTYGRETEQEDYFTYIMDPSFPDVDTENLGTTRAAGNFKFKYYKDSGKVQLTHAGPGG